MLVGPPLGQLCAYRAYVVVDITLPALGTVNEGFQDPLFSGHHLQPTIYFPGMCARQFIPVGVILVNPFVTQYKSLR